MTIQDDEPDALNREGSAALAKYRAHGGGIELFRAYVERRKADTALNEEKRQQLEASLPKPGEGIPQEEFKRITAELLRMSILDELDPVIHDLLRICEGLRKGQQPASDQLVNLRSALRIGKGHSPYDTDLVTRRWEIEQRWTAAYLQMQDSRAYRSESDIASEIAKTYMISKRTALNYWGDLKKLAPWQAAWAKEIEIACKKSRVRPADTPPSARPTKKQKKRITFGKVRANH